MRVASRGRRVDTTDRLRSEIDQGRTGDKVSFPDPAAVPLGTDEEAAGTPPSREAVAVARKSETSRPSQPSQHRHGLRSVWIIIGFVIGFMACVVGIGSWMLIR
jgi:hypothetical protein